MVAEEILPICKKDLLTKVNELIVLSNDFENKPIDIVRENIISIFPSAIYDNYLDISQTSNVNSNECLEIKFKLQEYIADIDVEDLKELPDDTKKIIAIKNPYIFISIDSTKVDLDVKVATYYRDIYGIRSLKLISLKEELIQSYIHGMSIHYMC